MCAKSRHATTLNTFAPASTGYSNYITIPLTSLCIMRSFRRMQAPPHPPLPLPAGDEEGGEIAHAPSPKADREIAPASSPSPFFSRQRSGRGARDRCTDTRTSQPILPQGVEENPPLQYGNRHHHRTKKKAWRQSTIGTGSCRSCTRCSRRSPATAEKEENVA